MSASLAVSAPRPAVNPWVVAVVVALASFMEILDTTIANVALRYIAGSLGVSADQASWVVTTYLVANAVIVTATAFLARRFGRKRFFIACMALFTLSSVLCGFATSLDELLLFRILQGFAGGGMVPVAQSILADSFPPEKRGQAFALFGLAVVVAPVVGPTLGGWLSDNWSWHWCFLINGPVGLATIALIAATVPDGKPAQRGERFDIVGFVLIALFMGALEIVLDRGQIEDWFGSRLIVGFTALAVLSLGALIPWALRHAHPIVDLRLLSSRQFGASFVVMLATGASLLATTQYMPQLVQEDFGYTATWAGLALSPGGLVAMAMMFLVGRLSRRVQPKYLIAFGAAVIAASMYGLTNLNGALDFWFFAGWRMLLSVGLPLVFVPIMAASYDGLRPEQTDMASALMNAARNTGGSIGVSLAANVLADAEQLHLSRLAEHVTPSSVQYQQTLARLVQYFGAQGSSPAQAHGQAIAWIGAQAQTQASLLAYIDVFSTLMALALLTIPLALMLRKVKLGGAAPAGH